MPRTIPLEQAFWSKVNRRGPDECWLWTGRKNHKGYGQIRRMTRGKITHIKVTKLAWSLKHAQPFPEGKIACHRCDNPSCVNPDHIWPGTSLQNNRDCISKGRWNGFGYGNRSS